MAEAGEKKKSKRVMWLVIGGALLIVCLCFGAVMSFGEDGNKTPTPTTTTMDMATQQPAPTITKTIRATWTPKPTATHKPTEAPTMIPRIATIDLSTATPFIFSTNPPPSAGCNCSLDYNCPDFSRRSQAQACFNSCGGSASNNWSGLDNDHDGIACESLP